MKQLSKIILLIAALLLISGCGNENRQNPYMMGEQPSKKGQVFTVTKKKEESAIRIATIEAETQKEIAKINKERDVEIQKMEQDTKLAELKTHNEMAVKEHNLSTFVHESTFAFKNSTLIVGALGSIILLALIFYIFRKRREDKLKMHEDEMQKEMFIREKELQVQMAEKILDAIASGKLSDEREQHLLEALDKTTTPTLTHKK